MKSFVFICVYVYRLNKNLKNKSRFLLTEYEMPDCLRRLNMCYVGECNYSNSPVEVILLLGLSAQTQMVIYTSI